MDQEESNRRNGTRYYQPPGRNTGICRNFQSGRCSYGSNCRFIHPGQTTRATTNQAEDGASAMPTFSQFGSSQRRERASTGNSFRGGRTYQNKGNRGTKSNNVCTYWLAGNCRNGDNCNFLHEHTNAPNISLMIELKGHEKSVHGLALPENSSQLYSGSQDGTIRVWDCVSGQLVSMENIGSDIGSLLWTPGWLFVGTSGQIKTYNLVSGAQGSLPGPSGQVNSLRQFADCLFAGCHDGRILSYKFQAATSSFEPLISLEGHKGPVVSMQVFGDKLYSGSADKTIRVWDLSNNANCVQTVVAHMDVVMGLHCFESNLISCSLDDTIKVWSINPVGGSLDVVCTFPEAKELREKKKAEQGCLAVYAGYDPNKKAILLASFNDNTVRVFDIPSFTERGCLFSKEEVRVIHMAAMENITIIFTGDSAGEIKVWQWLPSLT